MISFVEYNFEIFKLIYLLLQLTQPSKVDYLFLDLAFKSLLQFEFMVRRYIKFPTMWWQSQMKSKNFNCKMQLNFKLPPVNKGAS